MFASDIEYLKRALPSSVEEEFFTYLKNLTPTGLKIYALQEGTIAFPRFSESLPTTRHSSQSFSFQDSSHQNRGSANLDPVARDDFSHLGQLRQVRQLVHTELGYDLQTFFSAWLRPMLRATGSRRARPTSSCWSSGYAEPRGQMGVSRRPSTPTWVSTVAPDETMRRQRRPLH